MGTMESGGVSPFPQPGTPESGLLATDVPLSQRKRKICVYCGASVGKRPEHMEAARQLARVMAANDIGLVYGGGTIGLMGEIAKTLVALAGPDAVHGIIPEPLVRYERDPTYTSTAPSSSTTSTTTTTTNGATGTTTTGTTPTPQRLAIPDESVFGRTTIVPDMHTRKRRMAQEVAAGGPGSGFVALPGGFGTVEELLEMCTWSQLGIQSRGICVLNVGGFYDGLLAWIATSVAEGFIRPANQGILVAAATPEAAVKALAEYTVSDAIFKLKWGNE